VLRTPEMQFEYCRPSQAVGLQQPNAGQFRRPRPLRSHPRRLQGVPALYPQRWRTARLDRARDHRRRLRLPCARVEIWTGHQRLERCTVRRWLPDCLGSTFRYRGAVMAATGGLSVSPLIRVSQQVEVPAKPRDREKQCQGGGQRCKYERQALVHREAPYGEQTQPWPV
jgi:hypothetical protein